VIYSKPNATDARQAKHRFTVVTFPFERKARPAAWGLAPRRESHEGVNKKMRKNFALFLVAMMALTMVFAAVGCGQKPAEQAPATEAPSTEAPATEMPMDSTAMPADTTAMAH